MDSSGHFYSLDADQQESLLKSLSEIKDDSEKEEFLTLREDVARLEGYLKARSEADAPKRERVNSDFTRRSLDEEKS